MKKIFAAISIVTLILFSTVLGQYLDQQQAKYESVGYSRGFEAATDLLNIRQDSIYKRGYSQGIEDCNSKKK